MPAPPVSRRTQPRRAAAVRAGSVALRASVALAVLVATVPLLAGAGRAQTHAATSPPAAPAARTVLRPDAATFAWRASAPARLVIGRSLDGREIVARRQGPADARRVVLLLGQMHGDEPRGRAVVRETRRLVPPPGVQVWTVSTMNPDGSVRGTRQNARRVDLNRNFPHRWRPTSTSRTYYPGRSAASEPETRQMMRFLDRLRPQLVVSLHQAYRSVDIGNPKSRRWAVRLARAFDLPTVVVPCRGPCAGTLAGWYNARYAGYAVTVELPRRVSTVSARRYARAVMSVAGLLAPTASPTPTPSPTPVPTSTSSPTPSPTAT